MANKAIKYRLYPTTEQRTMFTKTFGCCRKVYNLMLADKIKGYKATGKFPTVTPAMYKKDYPFLKEVDSLALACAWSNLQKAFNNRFSKSRKKKNGFPNFKSAKHSRRSYTTCNQKGLIAIIDNKYIRLPKYGKVKAKIHRIPDEDWLIKSVTVSQDSDGKLYASVLFEFDKVITQVPVSDNAIGLDFAVATLFTDSNGDDSGIHKYYKESHCRLTKEQRKLSKKQKFSNNFYKQKIKVAKVHKHISNMRKDFLHKKSTEIANQYDAVCIEDISIRKLASKRKFKNYRKSLLDNGWYNFITMLQYKLNDRGKRLIKIDRSFPSSKLCHCCGNVNTTLKDDSIRKWTCPACGASHQRDFNAAINIKNEGLKILKVI